jgi:UDP-glucose 4-epimerase
MADRTVVLVTGVAGYWGFRVAEQLAGDPARHVIGLDLAPPDKKVKGLDFIPADLRSSLLTDLLALEAVDTVCHLAFIETTRPVDLVSDLNVNGTTNLLAACAQAGVRKVVLKSSTTVYGARPGNSAFLGEDHALRGSRTYGYTRDLVDIETFCAAFRRQAPGLLLTVLRFPSIVGPVADTPMTRFLSRRWAPSLLGFNPRMQIIHEEDVVAALIHAVNHDAPGAFNVAAGDILPLNRVRSLAGKSHRPIFHPLIQAGTALLTAAGLRLEDYLPIEPDYLRYPWVGDLTRMRTELGFEPRHAAEETLRQFARQRRLRQYLPDAVLPADGDERLRDIIEQRRQAREP